MEISEIEEYSELSEYVEENKGVATVSMRLLADVHGVGRLGKHVRTNIADKLKGEGLGHYPGPKLPNSQSDKIRLYKHGSSAGELVKNVLSPGENADEEIRSLINQDAQRKVERIKELLCE
jgi:hypothetical protein